MPRLSVWFVRTALLYLTTGFTFGGLMLANKGMPYAPLVWALLPAHIEFLLVGWMVQLALGVGFWILPRFSAGSRGNVSLAWASYGLLNLGIWMVAAVGVFRLPEALIVAGRALEIGAAISFALHVWGRVRPTYPGTPH
jgi:hypothetical protein